MRREKCSSQLNLMKSSDETLSKTIGMIIHIPPYRFDAEQLQGHNYDLRTRMLEASKIPHKDFNDIISPEYYRNLNMVTHSGVALLLIQPPLHSLLADSVTNNLIDRLIV